MTLSLDQGLLEDLQGDHLRTHQDNQEEEDLRVSHHLEGRLVLHLRVPLHLRRLPL
jgi:hypothetical protein